MRRLVRHTLINSETGKNTSLSSSLLPPPPNNHQPQEAPTESLGRVAKTYVLYFFWFSEEILFHSWPKFSFPFGFLLQNPLRFSWGWEGVSYRATIQLLFFLKNLYMYGWGTSETGWSPCVSQLLSFPCSAAQRSPALPKCSLWRLSCVGPVVPGAVYACNCWELSW